MSSILKVDTIQDSSGNNIINESSDTITIGASGDTTNIVGTLQNNGVSIDNTPAFAVRKTNGDQSYSQNTATKVTFNTELLDTNSAFASDKFTVPSGEAGTYLFNVSIRMGAIAADSGMNIFLYKNGSEYTRILSYVTDESENPIFGAVQAMDLSVADYVEVYGQTNGGAGNFKDNHCQFTGFKLGA